ncbi:hypothetical protein [Mesorhizobium retamae]|uniref:Uncharacterized protein n=1 Tax=Mesorhizobium retamae TaxID=2912854 RepID=A0ABS9QQ83_9HYPH|nr:hypothetical protein [Mesorhizobium sp. IRAMC:0171]MCG7509008.1 hypothetical protein [Mesorhizobium sp. IRAMC:0171]
MFILTSPVNFQNVFSDFWLKANATNRHLKDDARAPLSAGTIRIELLLSTNIAAHNTSPENSPSLSCKFTTKPLILNGFWHKRHVDTKASQKRHS